MITNNQIQELAETFGVADLIVEKDYFIELFMVQAFLSGLFKKEIVFRGGTALKKAYFRDYRFSEDIDFIIFEKNKLNEFLEILKKIVNDINKQYPWNSKIRSEINNERLQAFVSYDIIPEIRTIKELKIDIIEEDDKPAYPLMKMKFNHDDYKNVDVRVNTYELETVISDKMARIISITKEARDIYDLWKLMAMDLNIKLIKGEFKNKMGFDAEAQTVVKHMKNDVFKKTWKSRLEAQVPGLPSYEQVVDELGSLMERKLG